MNLFQTRVYCLTNTQTMYKKGLLILALLLVSQVMSAQAKPETVYRITELQQQDQWYKEQIDAWRGVVKKEPKNGDAWLNLYRATRYYKFPAFRTDSVYHAKLDGVVDEMEAAIPNSFEFHWIKFWNGSNDDQYWHHILEAHKIDPDRPEIYEDMVSHYELNGEWEKVDEFSKKWYDSQIMAPSLLWLGYNMMQSAEENGIYFTHGDNDTYPLIVLQHGKQFRTDLTVMNLYMMQNEEYTRKLFSHKGIKFEESELKKMCDSKDWTEKIIRFTKHVAEQNPDRKVYFSPSSHSPLMEEMRDDLWCVGLAYLYCEHKVNKPAIIRKNLEQNLKMDHLEANFYSEKYIYEKYWAPKMNMLYFEPFAQLYEHYLTAGDDSKAAKYRSKSIKLAQAADMESEVTQLLDSLRMKVTGK